MIRVILFFKHMADKEDLLEFIVHGIEEASGKGNILNTGSY